MTRTPEHRIWPLACIHGRFQPFHLGHWDYLRQALDRADRVIVGITNPILLPEAAVETTDGHRHRPDSNPFTYFERSEMVLATVNAYGAQSRICIVPFDVNGESGLWSQVIPLDAVQLVTPHEPWDLEKEIRFRSAGYETSLLETRDNRITATRVRSHISTGMPWRHLVPEQTANVIDRLGLDARLTQLAEESP